MCSDTRGSGVGQSDDNDGIFVQGQRKMKKKSKTGGL